MAAVSAGARQSGSPIASSSSARPSQATWIPTRMSTIAVQPREWRVVLVLAGDPGKDDPRTVVSEEGRDGSAGECLEDGALVGEERRDHFQPRVAAGRRQTPQAREVP